MIVVTGATGTVGREVVARLLAADAPVRALSRNATVVDPRADAVRFSTVDAATWPAAFASAEAMFLMRPPQIARVRRDLLPAVAAARDAGVRRVVFLSVLGAERNPFLPHRRVERWLETSGAEYTALRAGNFMQNLSTVHGGDIRAGRLVVPAGAATMSYVDADDVAAVAARCLLEDGHARRAYDVTGPEAVTHQQVAAVLTEVLGHPVRYTRPSLPRYWAHAAATGMDLPTTTVTSVLYTLARAGIGRRVSADAARVLGRPPTTVRAFAERLHRRGEW